MTRKTILPLILFLSLGALAQNHTAMPGMTAHPNAAIIDGAQHPELIPDNTAYRLYFETVAKMHADLKEQQLLNAGLSSEEIAAAETAIQHFKAQWDALRSGYNQAVQAQTPHDRDLFLSQRDKLVEDLLSELKTVITTKGLSHLQAHVQAEKRHMKISATN